LLKGEGDMKKGTIYALFTGLGFFLGTAGVKAATSETARKGYVHAVAQGMRAKCEYENIVEQAKAEYDDIKAEASYIAGSEKAASAKAAPAKAAKK
jgi:hypothetical protein